MAVIEEELAKHGSYASCATGESMRPLLRNKRDVVIIEPIVEAPKKYDVILYRGADGSYILHRVVKKRLDCLVTRGDNTYVNEFVPNSALVGRMTAFNRDGIHTDVTDAAYIRYSKRRVCFYPARKCYVGMRAFLGKIKRKLLKKKPK